MRYHTRMMVVGALGFLNMPAVAATTRQQSFRVLTQVDEPARVRVQRICRCRAAPTSGQDAGVDETEADAVLSCGEGLRQSRKCRTASCGAGLQHLPEDVDSCLRVWRRGSAAVSRTYSVLVGTGL